MPLSGNTPASDAPGHAKHSGERSSWLLTCHQKTPRLRASNSLMEAEPCGRVHMCASACVCVTACATGACMHTRVHMHACVCLTVCVHVCVCVPECVCPCVHVCPCARVYPCMCVCPCLCVSMCMCPCARACVSTCACISVSVHLRVRVCPRARVYPCVHGARRCSQGSTQERGLTVYLPAPGLPGEALQTESEPREPPRERDLAWAGDRPVGPRTWAMQSRAAGQRLGC